MSADELIKALHKMIEGYDLLVESVEVNQQAILRLDTRIAALESLVEEHEDNIQDLTRQLNICGSTERFVQAERGEQPKATDDLIEKYYTQLLRIPSDQPWKETVMSILRAFAEECRK